MLLLSNKNALIPDEQALASVAGEYEPSTKAYLLAKLESGFEYTTTKMFQVGARESELDQSPISKEDFEATYARPGIKYEEGMSRAKAEVYADEYDTRQLRSLIIDSAQPGVLGTAAGFGMMLLGNLPDPINFVPFVGAAGKTVNFSRKAGITAKNFLMGENLVAPVGKATLQTGAHGMGSAAVNRTTKHLLARGALEGALGTAAADAIVLPALAERGEDVGFSDALLDITFGALLGGGLHYAGAKLGDEVNKNGKNAFSGTAEIKALRALATPEDRKVTLAAQDIAVNDFVENGQVNVKEVFDGTNTLSRSDYNRLVAALQDGDKIDVDFGKLRGDYKEALNAIRNKEGVQLIVDDNLVVPGNVVKKLHEKRMLQDGLSADRVAEILLNVFHNKADAASATRYPHIQALISLREELAQMGFIAIDPASGRPVVKSVYLTSKSQLKTKLGFVDEKHSGGTRFIPPSEKLGGAPPHLPAPRFSALQNASSEKNIIRLNREVNFSPENPEVFARAPELAPERRSAFEEAGIDPETKMSMEEAKVEIMKEDGVIKPEDMAEIEVIKNAETKTEQMEEAGLSIISCILEASK